MMKALEFLTKLTPITVIAAAALLALLLHFSNIIGEEFLPRSFRWAADTPDSASVVKESVSEIKNTVEVELRNELSLLSKQVGDLSASINDKANEIDDLRGELDLRDDPECEPQSTWWPSDKLLSGEPEDGEDITVIVLYLQKGPKDPLAEAEDALRQEFGRAVFLTRECKIDPETRKIDKYRLVAPQDLSLIIGDQVQVGPRCQFLNTLAGVADLKTYLPLSRDKASTSWHVRTTTSRSNDKCQTKRDRHTILVGKWNVATDMDASTGENQCIDSSEYWVDLNRCYSDDDPLIAIPPS